MARGAKALEAREEAQYRYYGARGQEARRRRLDPWMFDMEARSGFA